MSYKNEIVTSANYVTRPKEGSFHLADHHGVTVKTNQGNEYLIHSTPGSGVVVTDTKHMSKNWNVDHSIPVKGEKTVHDIHKSSSGRTTNPLINYMSSGTCINTAKNGEKALKK
ncbi:hypothetical protein PPL_06907 [Heterostelium album PN500]|uniref:Uncharacterized protein n=1 Tax=Heterostelium pallidum (strain ATCC 26659 / Pp 5 / PN500) TaxID=670386 RepID=D3BDV4_HETP5|nr:hypothetical protein PPL_06907 [Heterostelium album PN500]EFA80085.1 hypothetical protein PPL_06907 [Heterostelium album PN500]|eukprot:XP_020432205.1 hypothetical protein PPL_06907 [Heterostelium album PN500]